MLASIKDMRHACGAAYYLGVRAQSENRLVDAGEWYQVVLETGLHKTFEFQAAYDQLQAWLKTRRSLQYLQAHPGHDKE